MKHFGLNDAPPQGIWLAYRKTAVVQMLRMTEPFTCTNREDEKMIGQPGDFLVLDGYGGYYPCGAEFHAENYIFADE